MEIITAIKNGITIYHGTIAYLLKSRKDLLNLELDGNLEYKVKQGYFCKCK